MNAKNLFYITTIVLLTLISGCAVISFYPIYTEDVLIKDDRILGKWFTIEIDERDTLIWEISYRDKKSVNSQNTEHSRANRQETNKYNYWLVLHHKSEPHHKTKFQLHLIELDGKIYIDFYPKKWDVNNTILGFHLMGVHTFAKIDVQKESINIDWFDADWFEKLLTNNKIRIKHEKNNDNILLTTQPKDLQKFIIKYSDDENAFDKDSKLELKPLI